MDNPFPIPSKKALKRLGYLKDQKGIANRFLHESGWKKHIEKTKAFIVNSLKGENFQSISILGSGWFLDVPVDFFLEKYEKIYCFDINHPNQITHKYRNEKKIEFIEADISGGIIEKLYKAKKIGVEDIPSIKFNKISDVVLSLNLMSQLDNLLFEYSGIVSEQEGQIRKKIQEKHLEFLKNYRYLLITDYEEVYFDERGSKTGSKPTLHVTLPLGSKTDKWIWEFDTQKTYKKNCLTQLNVIAINNI